MRPFTHCTQCLQPSRGPGACSRTSRGFRCSFAACSNTSVKRRPVVKLPEAHVCHRSCLLSGPEPVRRIESSPAMGAGKEGPAVMAEPLEHSAQFSERRWCSAACLVFCPAGSRPQEMIERYEEWDAFTRLKHVTFPCSPMHHSQLWQVWCEASLIGIDCSVELLKGLFLRNCWWFWQLFALSIGKHSEHICVPHSPTS